MPADFSFLTDYRISLEGAEPGKFVSGYVRSVDGKMLAVESTTHNELTAGMATRGFLVLHSRRIDFNATIRNITADGFELELGLDIRVTESQQEGRHEVNLTQTARVNGVTLPAQITDVSVNGVGLELRGNLAVGGTFELEFRTEAGLVRPKFVVRYSDAIGDTGVYRIGAVLAETDAMLIGQYQIFVQSMDPLLRYFRKKAG